MSHKRGRPNAHDAAQTALMKAAHAKGQKKLCFGGTGLNTGEPSTVQRTVGAELPVAGVEYSYLNCDYNG